VGVDDRIGCDETSHWGAKGASRHILSYHLSLTNPCDALHYGKRAANKMW